MRGHRRVEQQGETVVITIPMTFKRRGGRKEIIVPDAAPDTRPPRPTAQAPLVVALARAFHWQELLDSGAYGSMTDLAAALRVDRSYVGRILRLALLAPDIVEAIVEGREPDGLSLDRLVKPLPLLWVDQRRALGFSDE